MWPITLSCSIQIVFTELVFFASELKSSKNGITEFLKGKKETVKGLAGLGDLYVSAAGGRNSKMGSFIGEGIIYSDAKKTKMPNVTIEGAELIFEIGKKVKEDFNEKKLTLMISLIDAILEDKILKINWENFNND